MPEYMNCGEAGRLGGFARAKKLSPERRSEIARNAINARWAKVRAQVEEQRRLQRMPRTVEDEKFLGQLAADVQGGGDRHGQT
jgi:hypothetical protein